MRTLATPPPAAASRVAIQSVEADAAGGLVAKGSAEPNATVRLYLNGANVADAKTQSDGRWSLTIKQGMTPGGYVMRADEIEPGRRDRGCERRYAIRLSRHAGSGARRRPPATRAAAAAAASAARPTAPPSADPVVDLGPNRAGAARPHVMGAQPKLLRRPDPLPGDLRGQQVAQIHNPNLIYPGEVFVVPKSEPKP